MIMAFDVIGLIALTYLILKFHVETLIADSFRSLAGREILDLRVSVRRVVLSKGLGRLGNV
jgi:hypothetical protein